MRTLLFVLIWLALGTCGLQAASVGGYTNLTYSDAHGTQIEYIAKNGTNYLWYPGNKIILPGHWKTKGKDICFKYGANTYNPATGGVGAKWECMPLALHNFSLKERVKGDPFGLSKSSKVPFVLRKSKTSLSSIAKRLGVSVSDAPMPLGEIKTRYGTVTGLPEDLRLASCDQVLAVRHVSKANELFVAETLASGKWMGKRCGDGDIVAAFQIFKKYGVLGDQQSFIRALEARAKSGNAYSQSQLRKLQKAGFVD